MFFSFIFKRKGRIDDIIRCMKEAEKIAVPEERIRIKTRKSIWAADPELKN